MYTTFRKKLLEKMCAVRWNFYIPTNTLYPNFIQKQTIKSIFKGIIKIIKHPSIFRYKRKMTKFPNISDFDSVYPLIENEYSKNLYIDLMVLKILKSIKIKFPEYLYKPETWKTYHEICKSADNTNVNQIKTSNDFILNIFDLSSLGYPIKMYNNAIGLYIIYGIKQYEFNHSGANRIKAQKGDYVIDGGGCFGDTALYFANEVGDKGKVFVFEFLEENINIFNKNINLNPNLKNNIELHQNALSNISDDNLWVFSKGAATYCSKEEYSSFEQRKADFNIKTISIDDFVRSNNINKIDFIKLDIEGSELDTLKGAVETIRNHKPTLAIAVYHKHEDLYEIPKLILSINPDYKIYIDHFTILSWETIMFFHMEKSK